MTGQVSGAVAAVQDKGIAGNETGRIAAGVEHHVGHFAGAADAPDRHRLGGLAQAAVDSEAAVAKFARVICSTAPLLAQ